jgi:hypothetical protein
VSESTPGCLKGTVIVLILVIGLLLIGGFVLFMGLGWLGFSALKEG